MYVCMYVGIYIIIYIYIHTYVYMYSGNDVLILSYIQVLKCKKQPKFPLDSTSPLRCRYGSRCVEAENASQAADCM